jgi:hypothetical protein
MNRLKRSVGWPCFARGPAPQCLAPPLSATARFARTVPLVIACGFVLGCRNLEPTPPEPSRDGIGNASAAGNLPLRNNCSSLLYELLEQEKNVSKLLLVKLERPPLKSLIKEISSVSKREASQLEKMAKQDRTLNLRVTSLPLGEKATREAISKTRTGELLRASGHDFELRLLLTQAEALSYAAHLAGVAAANEPEPRRARQFAGLSDEMQRLYADVIALLRSPASAASATAGLRRRERFPP